MYGLRRTAECVSSGGIPRTNTAAGALNPAARTDPAVETPIIWAGAQMMSWIRCLPLRERWGDRVGGGGKSILATRPRYCGFASKRGGIVFHVIDDHDAYSRKTVINHRSL